MSIYTKIFATASIFAIAATALVSPVTANAATLNLTNATLPSGHLLCVIADGGLSTSGTNVSSGASLTATKDGTKYTIVLVNSNSCANATATNTSAASTFYAYTNHSTQLAIGAITPGTVTPAAVPVFTATPTYANVIPVYNGDNTINICLGNTNSYTVQFTDADNDTLVESIAPVFPAAQAFVTSTNAAGSITYTVQPQTQAYSTLNNSFTVKFDVKEEALTNVIPAPYGAVLSKTITFKTVDACTPAPKSSVVASSSVTASSTAATTSSTAASATAAKSSTTATVEVDAPSAGKGSATVRTGGAY
jgi:hypothetical protein